MTTLLALLALTTSLQDVDSPKPSVLVGTMFARYANARTLSGKVIFRQTATHEGQTAEVTVSTELAVERPARLRLVQTSSKRKDKPSVVTSDGNTFTYEAPRVTLVADEEEQRLEQTVNDPAGAAPLGRIVAMARITLPDAGSPYLAVASAWEPDLRNLQVQWVTLQDGGSGEVGGIACRIVKGKWRQGAVQGGTGMSQTPTGVFGMWITLAGELLKYSTEEVLDVNDENKKPLGRVTILSEWTGTLAINPVLPDGTFTLVR